MAGRVGTLTISPMRIQDDTIPQAIAFANEINGGWQGAPTFVTMGQIPLWNRAWGMACVVYNDSSNNGIYVLTYGNTSTNLADNGNWKPLLLTSSTSNVSKIDQSINGSGTINLPANSLLFAILVNAVAELPAFNVGLTNGGGELVMTSDVASGFPVFVKSMYFPTATTIYFTGVATQCTCSAIIFTF